MIRTSASLALAFGLAGLAAAAVAGEDGHPLNAQLTGTAEAPNPGDPDGGGHATVRVKPGESQVCYDLAVENIAPATMAHIHKAPAGQAGPPVVMLEAPGADGKSSGCASASKEVVQDILQNPQAYYVNVHNAEHQPGAVRGQLQK